MPVQTDYDVTSSSEWKLYVKRFLSGDMCLGVMDVELLTSMNSFLPFLLKLFSSTLTHLTVSKTSSKYLPHPRTCRIKTLTQVIVNRGATCELELLREHLIFIACVRSPPTNGAQRFTQLQKKVKGTWKFVPSSLL